MISNALLLWSEAEVYQAVRIFDGLKPRRRFTNALILASLAACWLFLYIPAGLSLRIAIFSFASVIFFAMSGWRLIRGGVEKNGRVRQILGSGFWLMALIFTLRAVVTLLPDNAIPSLLVNTPLQSIVFGGTSLGVIIISIAFLLMCTESFNNALVRQAAMDDLTGLYNRRKLEGLAQAEIARAQKTRKPLAFILMDADNFKKINDTYGHLAGDLALKVVADILKENLRSEEIVGRPGGDEFEHLLCKADTALYDMKREGSAYAPQDFSDLIPAKNPDGPRRRHFN